MSEDSTFVDKEVSRERFSGFAVLEFANLMRSCMRRGPTPKRRQQSDQRRRWVSNWATADSCQSLEEGPVRQDQRDVNYFAVRRAATVNSKTIDFTNL